VLRGLCQLYGLRPSPKELLEIAGTLGSDVPFFLTHGQALVKGRGEIIQRVQLPLDYWIVVASPPISISTAEVYDALKIDLTKRRSDLLLKKKINLTRLLQLMPKFGNDLEEVVFMKFPGLSDLKQSLLGAGASYSSMTGSGSSFFGLFGSGVEIDDILEYLKGRNVKVFICRPILMPPFRQ
jgi:4-diphosphocytidyl-2-C-methyl-D-erythritol kinase